jgi:hypothetical protein
MIWLPKYGIIAKGVVSQARAALHTKRYICLQNMQMFSSPVCWAEHSASQTGNRWRRGGGSQVGPVTERPKFPSIVSPRAIAARPEGGFDKCPESSGFQRSTTTKKAWVAQSDDLPLVTEAETVEQLMAKLPGIIRDLVDDNIRAPASRSN